MTPRWREMDSKPWSFYPLARAKGSYPDVQKTTLRNSASLVATIASRS
jgi:hypothetical protein